MNYSFHSDNNETAELQKALAFYQQAKDEAEQGNLLMCVAHLTQAIMLKEDYTEARQLRAEVLTKMGQFAEAAADYQYLIDLKSINGVFQNKQ